MDRKSDDVANATEQRSTEPYREPELISYGDVRQITANVGPKGSLDGGGGSAAGPKTGA